jgi:hypothetical protein
MTMKETITRPAQAESIVNNPRIKMMRHREERNSLRVSANALVAALAPKTELSMVEQAAYWAALGMLEVDYKMALTVTIKIETNEGG